MHVVEREQLSPVEDTLVQIPVEKRPVGHLRRLGRIVAASCMALASGIFVDSDARAPDQMLLEHTDSKPFIDDTLTVMTANVHGWEGTDGSNFSDFAGALKITDPDVVCMQEVLADGNELNDLYAMGYSVYFDTTVRYPFRGRFGNAVMTRSPIVTAEALRLENPLTVSPRGAIFFEIETVEKSLPIANTHLSINGSESMMQIESLYTEIGHKAAILCGDFNQIPETIAQGPFGRMAVPLPAPMLTYPATSPRIEIDHVISECGSVSEPTELVDIGSDHLARIETFDISNC